MGPRPRTPARLRFCTFYSQPLLRSTWPYHMSCRIQSTFARSSSCIPFMRSCKLTWSLLVTSHVQRITALAMCCEWCSLDKVEALDSLAWSMALLTQHGKVYLWKWWEISGRWAQRGTHWICHEQHGILSRKRVHSHHLTISSPEVTKGWHHLKFLPTHCDLCHWSAIYLFGPSSTSLTPEAGIKLQRTRDTTTHRVDPTGTTSTKAELVPKPLRHRAHGYLPKFWSTLSPGQDSRIMVSSMLNRSPFFPC